MALDDIVAIGIDHRKLDIFKSFLREDPLLPQFRDRQHTKQQGVLCFTCFRIAKTDEITESNGLFAIDRVRIGAGYIDRISYIGDPTDVIQKIYSFIGNGIIISRILSRPC